MADDADIASEKQQQADQLAIEKAKRAAQDIPKGVEGDCGFCGEWTSRLVGGACAPCRDKRGLG